MLKIKIKAMITEYLIRKKFIHDTIKEDIDQIYATQENTVRTYFKNGTGDLAGFLSKKPIESHLDASEGYEMFYMRVFSYLRFLDIAYRRGNDRISKHVRKNLALYNRVIWGVLFHETFPKLRYGFTDEIRKSIHDDISQSLSDNQKNKERYE